MLEVCIVVKLSCRLSPRQIPGGYYSRQKATLFFHAVLETPNPLVDRCGALEQIAWSSTRSVRPNLGLVIRLVVRSYILLCVL